MSIYINGKLLDTFNFPGGECHVKIDVNEITESTKVLANLYNSNDIMCLLLAVDAIRRVKASTEIHLTVPYFPYARQDRVCNSGESLSIKVMADIINSIKCASVTLHDPHSDVTPALLNNCRVISLPAIVCNSLLSQIIKNEQIALVSPDAGAEKKTRELGKRLSDTSFYIEVFYATKVRDTLTGEIISTEIHADVSKKNLIIIDDICDGGHTFIELSKMLQHRGARSVYLYVTHGIFSKGLAVLQKYFKHIYCYHTFLESKDINNDFLTVLSSN